MSPLSVLDSCLDLFNTPVSQSLALNSDARLLLFATQAETWPLGEWDQPPEQLGDRSPFLWAAAVEQHWLGQLQPQPEASHDQGEQLQRHLAAHPWRQLQQWQECLTPLENGWVTPVSASHHSAKEKNNELLKWFSVSCPETLAWLALRVWICSSLFKKCCCFFFF